MKATLLIILIAFTSSIGFAQNAEDESIKKVINAETDAAYKSDMDAWQRTWLHSPKADWVVVGNGFYRRISGWDSLSAFIGDIMKGNPTGNKVSIKTDSFNITSDGNMAWADFQQIIVFPATSTDTG